MIWVFQYFPKFDTFPYLLLPTTLLCLDILSRKLHSKQLISPERPPPLTNQVWWRHFKPGWPPHFVLMKCTVSLTVIQVGWCQYHYYEYLSSRNISISLPISYLAVPKQTNMLKIIFHWIWRLHNIMYVSLWNLNIGRPFTSYYNIGPVLVYRTRHLW